MSKATMMSMDAATPNLGRLQQWLQMLADNKRLPWLQAPDLPPRSRQRQEGYGNLLAPLLDACGWQGDIMALIDALPVMNTTLAATDLMGIMGGLGYSIETRRSQLHRLSPDWLPALFVPDTGAPRVLRELTTYGLIWDDGEARQRETELPVAERKSAGTGTLYTFRRGELAEPIDETEEHQHTASSTALPAAQGNWLGYVARRLRPIFWHALGLSLAMYIFALGMPLFSMAVYDRVLAARAPEALPMLAAGICTAFITEFGLRMIRMRLVGWMGARAGLVICQSMFERLLFLPASLIEQASVSAQIARIRAFESLRDFITGPMFMTLLELPFIAVLIAAMAFLSGPVAWVAVGMVALYGVMIMACRKRWRRLGRELAHCSAQRQQLTMEIVDKLKPVYASGIGDKMLGRYRAICQQTARAQHAYTMTTLGVQYLSALLMVAAAVLTINWSLSRIWAGEMTGGAMVAAMIITWRLLYPLQALCGIMPNYEQVSAAAKQVTQLMTQMPETHAQRHHQASRTFAGAIEFANVGLRYSRRSDPVFIGLTATIRQGQILAVYGGNGCGKSSVLRLLLGLYAPAMGTIKLDGVDHRQLDPRVLRRQIAYLPQTPEFLPGTVADNLRVSNPLASAQQLRQALQWSEALDMVDTLPDGLDTILGDGAGQNINLGGGLPARLALARLYLCNRPIVLCDELPVSILNGRTGERFVRFLEDCRGKRTVVFVTLREDWLQYADQVIWLKPGGIPVVGRPERTGARLDANMRPHLANITKESI